MNIESTTYLGPWAFTVSEIDHYTMHALRDWLWEQHPKARINLEDGDTANRLRIVPQSESERNDMSAEAWAFVAGWDARDRQPHA